MPISLLEAKRRLLSGARSRARAKGLPFNLTVADIDIPDRCPALGIPLVVGQSAPTDASPSLDRIIPGLGYTRDNVLVVSQRANRAKSDLAIHELERLAAFYSSLFTSHQEEPDGPNNTGN